MEQKWILLALTSLGFLFGQYAFQDLATDQFYYKYKFNHQISNFQFFFANINSFTLIVTSICAPLIGIFCDKYGTNIVLLVHQIIKLLSSVLQMVSIYASQPHLLFISRIAFNSMNGQTGILTAGIVAGNFQKGQMAFPNSIISMVTILGSGVNMYFGPIIIEKLGYMSELFVCVILQAIGLIFYLITLNFEIRKNQEIQNLSQSQKLQKSDQIIENDPEQQQQSSSQQCLNFKRVIKNSNNIQQDQNNNNNGIFAYLKKICSLSKEFWLACFIYCSFNIIYQSIDSYGNIFVMEQWNMSNKQAAATESLFPLITFTLPLFGIFIDKNSSKSKLILVFTMILLTLSIFLLFVNPSSGFLLFGISNALRLALILPILSQVIPEYSMIPTGNAILKCLNNVLGFIFQEIVGFTYLSTGSYQTMIVMCFFVGVISIFLSLGLLLLKQFQLLNISFDKSKELNITKQLSDSTLCNSNILSFNSENRKTSILQIQKN